MLTGAIGIIVAFVTIRWDARKTANQELIKKRIEIYDSVAPKLNELLCFFLSRGAWKTLQPPLIIQRKRELDQTMYVYGPLFSAATFDQYNVFMHCCFRMFTGVGHAARLRADLRRLQQEWGTEWQPEWDSSFVAAKEVAIDQDVMRQYNALLNLLAAEIGARQKRDLSHPAGRSWRRGRS